MKNIVSKCIVDALAALYDYKIDACRLVLMRTKKSFAGELSLVMHPLSKPLGLDMSSLGDTLGQYLVDNNEGVIAFNHAAGFLNLSFSHAFWYQVYQMQQNTLPKATGKPKRVLVEYGSPNTNKPLHLGHVRNCVLGRAVVNILGAVGYEVTSVQVINDRGIHICQSMAAWQLDAHGATPESIGMKGDHFVGKYYVRYNEIYNEQKQALLDQGMDELEAKQKAPIYQLAESMLRDWEAGDETVRALWQRMNQWVYSGFDITYKRLGISFDKNYYESDTYLLGKQLVLDGLDKGLFYQKTDGSIWVDLTGYDLDHKLLLRADATSVYMTQDIGTAVLRYQDYAFDKMVYTVANEQDYHFQVLFKILELAGYSWAQSLVHLSYGIVLLPQGRMKSREGTVVDADDLLDTMVANAKSATDALGKANDFNDDALNQLHVAVAHAALNYWILKVEAKKDILFNPEDSITFNGNTGPFLQYTYARIRSIARKQHVDTSLLHAVPEINAMERSIIAVLDQYNDVLHDAAESVNPSVLAGYIYSLAKLYNTYYHDTPILKADNGMLIAWRVQLSNTVSQKIHDVCTILGIPVIERM